MVPVRPSRLVVALTTLLGLSLAACGGGGGGDTPAAPPDTTPPSAPIISATTPASPSNAATPHVVGFAEAGAIVRIYATPTCSGTPLATGLAAGGNFDLPAAASQNSTTAFRATATDAAGNVSPCSGPISFVHDGVAPAAPALAATAPASPSAVRSPNFSGTAEAGSTVWIYASATCSGTPIASGTAAGGNFNLTATVPANAATSFTATATDPAGNLSGCSAPLVYRHDDLAPAAPALAATSPASPSTNASPQLTGSAEASATVRVFASGSCAGAPVATAVATGLGAFDVVVPAATNATTSFTATATDTAGNVSGCSTALSYRHDDQSPAAPVLSSTTPAAPSNTTTPHVVGSAEPGATIRVFATVDCSGPPLASGTAPGGAFDLVAAATQNATTAFRATATDAAGNTSPCSASLSYLHDGLAPGAPALSGMAPVSPSSDASPRLSGSAETGATVRVYGNAACTGAPLASGLAAGGLFSVQVAASPNAVTTLAATATDAAGNASPCSSSTTYVHDSLAPAAPAGLASTPAAPSANANPHLTGNAEAGATVRIFASASCAGPAVATGLATGLGAFDLAVPAAANAITAFTATATDAAGNPSGCSGTFSYRHDDQPPGAPVLSSTTPVSPSNGSSPHLLGSAEAGATVRAYATADCSGPPLATGTATGGAFDLVVAATQNATTAFRATATDAAGNTSSCSASLSYVQDGIAPAAPALTGTTPASPSNDPSPHLAGTAEAGATVRVYGNAACTGAPLASVVAAGGTFSVPVAVTLNVVTTLAATATDAAGNPSACSSSTTYLHDGLAPGAPALVATTPVSPSSNPAPHLTGNAEANATIRIYDTAACTGSPLVTGPATGSGAFDLVVAASSNATRIFRATATDAAGNGSLCSAPLPYVHDDVVPAAPVLTGTTPPSPSPSSLTPTVSGTAEPFAAVELHAGAACGGPPLASGFADGAGAFGLQVTVTANSTTVIGALARDAAGNTSPCSITLTYVHDDIAPAAPVLSGSAPASPANHNAPAVQGTAEPASSVALFTNALCTGSPAATGTAAGDGSFSVGVAVADNTTTTFHAKSTDAAGNPSSCSLTSVVYVEESRTFSVSPSSVELDPAPSPLSSITFSYALAGGPDAGVTWSVEEPGGGTVDAAGHYLAPAQTGTYHVSATTQGALPTLVARATIVVRSPVVSGTIAYAGSGPGRIFVSLASNNSGGAAVGGTSVPVTGPGSYPYTVRGVVATGSHRVSAWYDAAGVVRFVPSVDPFGQADVTLAGASLSGVNVTLVVPAAVAPVSPGLATVFPADGAVVVPFDGPRDGNGNEIADGYDVSCTTGAPPALPPAGAIHVPAGSDGVAFVRGLTNGLTYTCSAWASNHGVRSAPALSAPVLVGTPPGGFTVSGTIGWTGPAPAGPAYVVLLDRTMQRARMTRYASPTFPLSYSVPGVPAGDWVLGLLVDSNDDGTIAPTEFNSMSNGAANGLPVTVAADLSGQDVTFTRANATARAVVSHRTSTFGDSYDLYPLVQGGARLPATAVAIEGPDVLPPVDLGVARDGGGGGSASLTAVRSLGATPPAAGTYLFDVTYTDGTSDLLSVDVTGASILAPPTPVAPVGGASASSQPLFSWAEPIPAPASPYTYRLVVRQLSGSWVWETDELPASTVCAAGTCQAAFDFDGRAQSSVLAPGDYEWELSVHDAASNQAWSSATFHVPVDVTVAPAIAALYPGESTLLTAAVTGGGSVTWSATCGTVTPRADPRQADYVAPASGPCRVTATSTAEASRTGSATITVKPIDVAVTPSSVSLEPGQVQIFTAAIGGPGSVTWSSSCGPLTDTSPVDPLARRLQAPGATGPCTVTATSTVQPGRSGTAAVTVTSVPQLQVDPPLATLNPSQSQPFVAKLSGSATPAFWSVVETGAGTVGADGVYLAPASSGLYHVVATTSTGFTATAVVQVVDAGANPQPAVSISPASMTMVISGNTSFSATVTNCVDQSVSWSVTEPGGGSIFPSGPSSTNYQAPWSPGVYHLVARATCDSTKTAVATISVRLPSVSGTVSAPAGTGRIYVALVTNYGEVVSGTSLPGPGPFTLRGIQNTGDYVVRAWRDTLDVVTYQPNLEPHAEISVNIPFGADLAGVAVGLAAVSPAAPPAPSSVSVAPGDGAAVVFVNRVEDSNRNSLADGYHLSCDPVPAGTTVTFDATLSDDEAFVLKAPNGTTWSCEGWATAGGLESAHVSSGTFAIGAGPGGVTVSGVVTGPGVAPAGPLYVIVFSQSAGIHTQRIASPVFPQAFSISGVPPGDYQVGAFLDRADDGVMARTDPLTFRDGGGMNITVAGAPISGLALSLAFADAKAQAATSHWVSSSGDDYTLQLDLTSNLKVPREAVLTGGPGLFPPVDLGVDSNQGGGEVRLQTRFHLGSVRPQVGDTYDLDVTWTDGTTTTLHPQVTAVLDPPTPLAPVDPLGTPILAPAKPLFQWAAPATVPAAPYTYSVYVYQGASWNLWELPPSQLQATYGDQLNGSPPASPLELGAGEYRWVVGISDADRNYASREATFTIE